MASAIERSRSGDLVELPYDYIAPPGNETWRNAYVNRMCGCLGAGPLYAQTTSEKARRGIRVRPEDIVTEPIPNAVYAGIARKALQTAAGGLREEGYLRSKDPLFRTKSDEFSAHEREWKREWTRLNDLQREFESWREVLCEIPVIGQIFLFNVWLLKMLGFKDPQERMLALEGTMDELIKKERAQIDADCRRYGDVNKDAEGNPRSFVKINGIECASSADVEKAMDTARVTSKTQRYAILQFANQHLFRPTDRFSEHLVRLATEHAPLRPIWAETGLKGFEFCPQEHLADQMPYFPHASVGDYSIDITIDDSLVHVEAHAQQHLKPEDCPGYKAMEFDTTLTLDMNRQDNTVRYSMGTQLVPGKSRAFALKAHL